MRRRCLVQTTSLGSLPVIESKSAVINNNSYTNSKNVIIVLTEITT